MFTTIMKIQGTFRPTEGLEKSSVATCWIRDACALRCSSNPSFNLLPADDHYIGSQFLRRLTASTLKNHTLT